MVWCDVSQTCSMLDQDDLNVIYLLALPREMYHKFARKESKPLNRADFLATLTQPLRSIMG